MNAENSCRPTRRKLTFNLSEDTIFNVYGSKSAIVPSRVLLARVSISFVIWQPFRLHLAVNQFLGSAITHQYQGTLKRLLANVNACRLSLNNDYGIPDDNPPVPNRIKTM